MLFGANGGQGVADNTLDMTEAQRSCTGYEAFTTDVVTFEPNAGDHGLENLINAIDPSAFYEQTSSDIAGHRRSTAVTRTWFRTAS